MEMWRTIESYPPCEVCGKPECDWGPETLLLMPGEHGPFEYVGHKEAGMWLVRDSEDPVCWGELAAEPTHWAPLPAKATDP